MTVKHSSLNSPPNSHEVPADKITPGELNIGPNPFIVNSIEIVGVDGEINKSPIEDSDNWDDAYSKRVDTWSDGIQYSSQTVSIDYNITNLKITDEKLNTIQNIDDIAGL